MYAPASEQLISSHVNGPQDPTSVLDMVHSIDSIMQNFVYRESGVQEAAAGTYSTGICAWLATSRTVIVLCRTQPKRHEGCGPFTRDLQL